MQNDVGDDRPATKRSIKKALCVLTQMELGLDCRPCKRLETISDTEPTEDGVLAKAKQLAVDEDGPADPRNLADAMCPR
jgi:hypothetical protein